MIYLTAPNHNSRLITFFRPDTKWDAHASLERFAPSPTKITQC